MRKKIITATLLSCYSLAFANTLSFDEKKAVTLNYAVSDSERNSPGYQIEYIDEKTGFHNAFPVDIEIKTFNSAEATEAIIELSAKIQTPIPGKLGITDFPSKIRAKSFKIKLEKGANTTQLKMQDLIQKAAEEFVDTRKAGTKGTAVALDIRFYIKDKEIASLRKIYSAHLE